MHSCIAIFYLRNRSLTIQQARACEREERNMRPAANEAVAVTEGVAVTGGVKHNGRRWAWGGI